jgi:hypothetical protein
VRRPGPERSADRHHDRRLPAVQGHGDRLPIEETATANASGLVFQSTNNQYVYTWKTENKWRGTCRQFVLKLVDGTEHRANFKFK